MIKLINKNELGLKFSGKLADRITNTAMDILGVTAINNYYSSCFNYKRRNFTQKLFPSLNIKYRKNINFDNNIPKKGGVIIVANHPIGTLDGLLMIDAIGDIRDDVKFLGNFLLMRIEPLNDYFLAVNPFNSHSGTNVSGIRKAKEHLEAGGCLIIFPAGEVSTINKRSKRIEDKKWSRSMMRFIERASVPIVPVYIDGANSILFHLTGLVHPILRTLQLPRELITKQNSTTDLVSGAPITIKRQREFNSLQEFSDYIRANVYLLSHTLDKKSKSWRNLLPIHKRQTTTAEQSQVGQMADKGLLSTEIEKIRKTDFLFNNGEFEVFFTCTSHSQLLMNEIGRLRELTFREVGEGTNKAFDTDNYDNYYYQLFIWDRVNECIVGGYRVGMGHEIMQRYGYKGFYTYTLFNFKGEFIDNLDKTIELGRSFVVKEYQRKPASLLLLWKGLLNVLLKHSDYRYLFGPVSISGEFSDASKRIIIDYVKSFHYNNHLAKCIKARYGIKGIKKIDTTLLHSVESIDAIDKIIKDIEKGSAIPVLVKKYLQLNGKILAFNIDPDFNNSLDAFILLDLQDVPQATLDMLSKEMNTDHIKGRFNKN